MRACRCASLVAALLAATTARAEVVSGPTVGEKAAALRVYSVSPPKENEELDFTPERKDKPTVFVFIQADKWDRPMFRFLKGLGESVKKAHDHALVVAVWLTEDQDKTKDYLPKLKNYNLDGIALTCFPGEKTGPKDWNVNSMAHATAVVVHRGKVAATFGYLSINETDVADVEKALKKALEKK
jgi:hypothetical protein